MFFISTGARALVAWAALATALVIAHPVAQITPTTAASGSHMLVTNPQGPDDTPWGVMSL